MNSEGPLPRSESRGGATNTSSTSSALSALEEAISARRRAEAALRESEERYARVTAGAGAAIWDWDVVARRVQFSPRWKALRGFSADEVGDWEEEWSNGIHPADIDRVMAAVREHFEGKTAVFSEEYRVRHKDGHWIWVWDRGIAQRDEAGHVIRMAGSETDITERKQAEELARQRLVELEDIYRTAPVGLCVLDRDLRFLRINERLAEINGIPAASHLGKTVRELMPHLADAIEPVMRHILATGEPRLDIEIVAETPALPGVQRSWMEQWLPIRNAVGEVVGLSIVVEETTARKQAEEALRASEERFRAIAEYTCDWESWVGTDGRPKWINPGVERITGVSVDTCLNMPEYPLPLIHPEDRERMRGCLAAALAGVAGNDVQFRIWRSDGVETWGAISWQPIAAGGAALGYRSSVRDITQRKQAEVELEQARHQLAEGQRIAHLGSWEFIAATQTTLWSDEEKRIYGLDPAQAPPDYETMLRSHIHPDDAVEVDREFRAALEAGAPFEIEHRIVRPDGSVRWTYNKAQPNFDVHGELRGYVGTTLDITERRRAEEQLRQTNERLTKVLAVEAVGVMFWDLSTQRLVDANDTFLRMMGYSRDDMLVGELTWRKFTPPEYHAISEAEITKFMQTGRVGPYEKEYFRKDGSRLWLLFSGSSIGANQCVEFCVDISERKKAEEALRVARNRLETALQASQVVLFHQDRELRYTWIHNPAMSLGVNEVVGKRDHDLLQHAGDAARTDAIKRSVMETGIARREEVSIEQDGRERCYDLVVKPDRDASGQITGVNCAAIDITVRKQAEQQLRGADRRKDDFLAMLAHELRNPLAPIRSGLESMKLAGTDLARIREARDIMERQINQMTRLIDDLMDVSRISRGMITVHKSRMNLVDALRDAIDASRPLIEARDQELVIDLPSEPVVVDGDLTRLAQVFTNLLNNAAKFTGMGGRIRLVVATEGRDVVVRIEDNGIGIPEHLLGTVFHPFAQAESSLERTQGGLGLGLNIARRLVEQHGGSITATSDGTGRGSTFSVRLPVVTGRMPEAAGKPGEAGDGRDAMDSGRAGEAGSTAVARRILVVDDNRDGVASLAMLLDLLGYETQVAYDGLEAVARAEAFRPDVIIMDVGMPRLNGFEACRRIREQPWGRAMVIVAQTGWGREDLRREALACGFDHYLIKPVDPAALRTLLAELQAG